jgi:hypothetical protein
LDLWLPEVEEHDYQAAKNYLSIAKPKINPERLRKAELTERRANDILRACRQPVLPMSDPGVHKNLLRALAGKKLSPVLIVDGDIADGYHRVSFAYWISPSLLVPCKVVHYSAP